MRKESLLFVILLLSFSLSAFSQEIGDFGASRHYFSTTFGAGVSLDINANGLHAGRYRESEVPDKPSFSGSILFTGRLGTANDVFNISFGLGYRGFWDQAPPHDFVYNPSYSDFLLYSKDHSQNKSGSEVRPLGGQLVVPAELHVNLASIGEDAAFFIGGGIEFGVRVYQSRRYADYFGAHVMNPTSFSFQPMIGVKADTEDFGFSLSLYYRHYLYDVFNTRDIPIDKFRANSLGLQLTVVFGDY